jgi:capsular polysaccharide biosynthesis protein
MSIKQFISIIKHWAWLLGVGLVVGLLAGFMASRLQEPAYKASTKLLVSREIKNDISSFAGLTNPQLLQTYVQILKSKSLRDKVGEELGVKISSSQVSVQQMGDTLIAEVTVEYPDAEMSAKIANSMVSNLIKESLALQTADFISRKEILLKQIDQAQTNINASQAEYDQVFALEYQTQLDRINEQITSLQKEYNSLQGQIAILSVSETTGDKTKLAEKQKDVEQLQSLLGIYQEQRANMIISGMPLQTSRLENIRLAQLQANIDEYQKSYYGLKSSLDSVEMALNQQTPFVVEIEQAYAPGSPVRPIPLLYTALSGMVGLLLAGVVVVLIESLKMEDQPESLAAGPVLEAKEPGVDQTMVVVEETSTSRETFDDAVAVTGVADEQQPVEQKRRSRRRNIEQPAH